MRLGRFMEARARVRNPAMVLWRRALLRFVSSPAQATLVTWMANSGVGTDETLKKGSLPLPVNFYSPVPDIDDLRRRRIWERRSSLEGIAFQPKAQVEFMRRLGRAFGGECAWPPDPTGNDADFYTENSSFSFACAAGTHCVIRDRKPKSVMEIGSGMSSLIISAALQANEATGAARAAYTVIDPYPSPRLTTLPGTPATVVQRRVEEVEVGLFDQLGDGDVLFVDSGHVVRIGGDVNFLILDVLPRLRPGVVVHFHDISLPFEYDEVYLTNPTFRMLWTEAYLLQAFLAHNAAYKVLLAMAFLEHDHQDVFREAFPRFDPTVHKLKSSSFWIARR